MLMMLMAISMRMIMMQIYSFAFCAITFIDKLQVNIRVVWTLILNMTQQGATDKNWSIWNLINVILILLIELIFYL